MPVETSNWENILRRELYHCQDPPYAEHLQLALPDEGWDWLKQPAAWLQARPLAAEVEQALAQIGELEWSGRYAWKRRLRRLDKLKTSEVPLKKLIGQLQSYHWFTRFLARHRLFHRGTEAVDLLKESAEQGPAEVRPLAAWLLESIAAETRARLAAEPEHWICPKCFTRCAAHHLGETYYGCRSCRKSSQLLFVPQGIIAVIDRRWRESYRQQGGLLRVNWLKVRQMFDFHKVEIIRATDQEIEHFVVQAGNDTDPDRAAKYAGMLCRIDKDCGLSENSLRILERTFQVI